MQNLIGFFSSDARPLYKEDIYRTLALPGNSIIHFRYNQKYIQNDIVRNYKEHIGKLGVIFFVTGNDLTKEEKDRNIEYHSIRKVTTKDILISKDTGYFHFYLELNDFIDCDLSINNPDKFVTRIAINEGIKHSWLERVEAVKDHFDDILFFKYELFSKNNKLISPIYSKLNNDAIFHIDDEKEYKLSFSFYDKLQGKSSLNIEDSNCMDVYYKECSNIGTLIDNRSFKLMTHIVSQNKTPSVLRISPDPSDNIKDGLKYEVVSFFEIHKRRFNTIIFGVISSFVFIAIILTQIIGVHIKSGKPLCEIICLCVAAVILFGFSVSLLFHRFNKK